MIQVILLIGLGLSILLQHMSSKIASNKDVAVLFRRNGKKIDFETVTRMVRTFLKTKVVSVGTKSPYFSKMKKEINMGSWAENKGLNFYCALAHEIGHGILSTRNDLVSVVVYRMPIIHFLIYWYCLLGIVDSKNTAFFLCLLVLLLLSVAKLVDEFRASKLGYKLLKQVCSLSEDTKSEAMRFYGAAFTTHLMSKLFAIFLALFFREVRMN